MTTVAVIETEYYALLQVEPSASEAELKKAYRKLAMQCHPDRNPAPEMADRFKDISNAYRVLSVARTREVYDRFGKAGINNLAALGEHLTADQLLEAMYGPSGVVSNSSSSGAGAGANTTSAASAANAANAGAGHQNQQQSPAQSSNSVPNVAPPAPAPAPAPAATAATAAANQAHQSASNATSSSTSTEQPRNQHSASPPQQPQHAHSPSINGHHRQQQQQQQQHPHHGRGASNGSIKRSNGSITSILIVALADLYNGCSKEVNIVRYTGCTDCNGSGRIFSSADVEKKPCADCMGSGYISRLAHHHSQPQSRQQQMVKTQCTACNGYGSVSISSTCRKCSASGILPERRKLAVHVEKGMKSGDKITLRGEGDCTPDTVANGNGAGDAILVLRQKIESNAKFIRHGNDLYTTATISLAEAMFGFDRVLLTHMDGRGIRVKRMQQPQQQQKTLQPGEVLVINGEGMPQYRRPFDKGDLYIRVNVELPSAEWLMRQSSNTLTALRSGLPSIPSDSPTSRGTSSHQVVDTCEAHTVDDVDGGRARFAKRLDEDWDDDLDGSDDEHHPHASQCTQQ